MWVKEHPTKPGYYWVRARGQLTGREYVHPVHAYSSKEGGPADTVFSDGENIAIDSDMFVEWYSEPIPMPALIYKGDVNGQDK